MEYKLEDLFDLQMGKTPSRNKPEYWDSDDHKWISISDLSRCGKYIESTKEYLSDKAVEESGISIIPAGTVVMSFKLSIGKTAIVPEPMYSNEAIMSFRDKHVVDLLPDYIYYMFLGRDWDAGTNKAVMGKTLNKATLSKISVKIHSIADQREIVRILDKVNDVIEARQSEIQKLDELIKARFVEMFGDRWSNNRSWPQKSLAESADFYNGKAHEQVVDENGKYILVTSRCIASDLTDYRRTNALLFPLKVGDICMVMSDVPNGKALAKCMRIDEDNKYTLNQRICCFRNYELNPVFFFYLLNRHEYLLSFNDGDSQTNLRKNDLLACPVINPPVDLQEQFATFVAQVDKSKVVVQKALNEAQLLFDSLMQQYFG